VIRSQSRSKIIIKTVHFKPEYGVHFAPELPVQFKPEWGVHFAPEYPTYMTLNALNGSKTEIACVRITLLNPSCSLYVKILLN
jgi:hypothetical protein